MPPADPWTVCRREHRRCVRTAPARRIARRPAAGWRRRESSPAAPLCRAAEGRAYRGEAGTCEGSGVGGAPLIDRTCILIRDRRGRYSGLPIFRSIDQAAVQGRQECIVENIRHGGPLLEFENLGD